MWLNVKGLFCEPDESLPEDIRELINKDDPEAEIVLDDYGFNTAEVSRYNKVDKDGVMCIRFYDGDSMNIKFDFDEFHTIKQAEDPTIIYRT